MRDAHNRKPRPPLDPAKLNELALSYVGRFATTRAKLRIYLNRKVRERGWDGAGRADIDGLAERFAAQGYIDDQAYALAKAQSLTGRGFGLRRVEQTLRIAGVDEADAGPARQHARQDKVEAALRFAQRRRLGPFSSQPVDRPAQERAIAAMLRAGHDFGLSRNIVEIPPGEPVDHVALAEHHGYSD
ncbi:MAG: RecX family transcriptional regulator [Sphingomonas sp.]|nr:RecX family transcriptional regulator [Sphingomonas sp.]